MSIGNQRKVVVLIANLRLLEEFPNGLNHMPVCEKIINENEQDYKNNRY